jgi:pimeloyl-ACP methyl ester carboxylesterase
MNPDPDFAGLMDAMTQHLKTEVQFPGTFDDAALARIKAPLRVLLAEREVLCDPREAASRAERIRNASVRLFAGAGHLLPMEKPREVAEAIL